MLHIWILHIFGRKFLGTRNVYKKFLLENNAGILRNCDYLIRTDQLSGRRIYESSKKLLEKLMFHP